MDLGFNEYDTFDESFGDTSYSYNQNAGKTLLNGKEKSPFLEAVGMVRQELSKTYSAQDFANAGPRIEADAQKTAREVYSRYNTMAGERGFLTLDMPREEFVRKVINEILGMGELTPLLNDQRIEDTVVNGPNEVRVFYGGLWHEVEGMSFQSSDRLLEIINRGISRSGKKANQATPVIDGILPDGERVSIVTYPITDVWPVISIRSHRSNNIKLMDFTKKYEINEKDLKKFDVAHLLPDYTKTDTGGMLSAKAATYLHAAVLAGLNIVVIGPTGCGKTTLLTALGKCIPEGRRILIIEDTPEIELHPKTEAPNNVIYLRTRAASLDSNLPPVTQADLVKLALRQRPDALTLGEARGEEVFDLLNALNTGHKNGLTSLHAEGCNEVFGRVFMMLSQSEQGRHLDRFRAASLAANTMNIIVTLQIHSSRRSVQSIVEYSGKLKNQETSPEPEIVPIFVNEGGLYGNLGPMLTESNFSIKFRDAGIPEFAFKPGPLPGERMSAPVN